MCGIEIYILLQSHPFILFATRVMEINIQSKYVMQKNGPKIRYS